MRTNANLKSRSKNSFIYFQLGLIGSMLVILFILEFQFKTIKHEVAEVIPTIGIDDEPDDKVYRIIERLPQASEPVIKNPLPAKTLPDVVNDFEVKDNNEKTNNENTSTQDNFTEATNTNNTPAETNNTTITEVPVSRPFETVFSVEQLPMFPECKGLSRAEQKECFETQLSKRVIKNVVYPGDDLESGKQGTALVEFIINEKGEITNVKALDNKRATADMQLAAVKAIKKLPKLIPAKQGQKAVKVKYILPVSFRLN